MAKLIKFWDSQHKLTHRGIWLVITFHIIRLVFWYVDKNISYSNMSTASTMNTVSTVILGLEIASIVLAVIGYGLGVYERKTPKEETVKLADGVWMIKK